MNENTTMVLRGALTHLRVQQQEIETAIAAILAVLGEGDFVPVAARQAPESPQPRRARRTPPARRSGKAAASTTSEETRAAEEATVAASGRAKPGEWQAQALRALRMGEGDAQVRELATRLRIAGPHRDKSIQGLWGALQALVKSGHVEKHGPRYRLAPTARQVAS